MTRISFQNGMIEVDPATIATGLQVTPDVLREGMRDGLITSLCEKGSGEDVGRWRLTFFSPTRRLRLIVTDAGEILQSSSSAYARPKLAKDR